MSEATMSSQSVRKVIGLSDAIEELWEAVIAGDYPTLGAAIEGMADGFLFNPADREHLLRRGLFQLARHAQASGNTRGTGAHRPQKAVGWGAVAKKEWERLVALTWPFADAGGQQKPLIQFSQADVAELGARMRASSLSFARRASCCGRTLDLMKKHRAERIMDLPPGVLSEVEADVLGAFSPESSK